MKRSSGLKRSAGPKRTKRVKPRNAKRRASEWARAYGSRERVAWVKALPCSVPGCTRRPCDNAHVETGGTGRKADADKIVALCSGPDGHHRQLHDDGIHTFEARYDVDLMTLAAITDARWNLSLADGNLRG